MQLRKKIGTATAKKVLTIANHILQFSCIITNPRADLYNTSCSISDQVTVRDSGDTVAMNESQDEGCVSKYTSEVHVVEVILNTDTVVDNLVISFKGKNSLQQNLIWF